MKSYKKDRRLIAKFSHAFNGFVIAFRTQSSFRIHILIAAIVYTLAIALRLTVIDWILINSAIIFVLVAELFNTAIERLCDFLDKRPRKIIMIIKDISAAAVLISVLQAFIVGGYVFIPYLLRLF
jgi:diacylglycerol kinase